MHVNESKVNPNTFARSLKETGGYTVGMFGKYLNNMPSQATVGDGGVFVRTSAYDSAEHQRMASPPHPFSNSSLSPFFLIRHVETETLPPGKRHVGSGRV